MTIKIFEITFDTATVIGATDRDPVVKMTKLESWDRPKPASWSGHIYAIVDQHNTVWLTNTGIFQMYVSPAIAKLARRTVYKVSENTWLSWYEDQEYAGKNNAWVQRRNRAILDQIASLGNLS